MNAWQLFKDQLKRGEPLRYSPQTVQPQKKLKKVKRTISGRSVLPVSKRPKAKPIVFGSRTDGSYTKRDNSEPKKKRKMREASQRLQRRK